MTGKHAVISQTFEWLVGFLFRAFFLPERSLRHAHFRPAPRMPWGRRNFCVMSRRHARTRRKGRAISGRRPPQILFLPVAERTSRRPIMSGRPPPPFRHKNWPNKPYERRSPTHPPKPFRKKREIGIGKWAMNEWTPKG